MAIKGGRAASIAALKKGLKRGGGTRYLTRIPEDGITVRFLTEPIEWFKYWEHYDANAEPRYFPCDDKDCKGCLSDDPDVQKTSKRYLANALDVAEGQVVPLVLQTTAANMLLKKYDKYATLTDRDYELSKEGSGFDTSFDVEGEPPTRMNVGKYDLLDLEEILNDQLAGDGLATDDEDEDEDVPAPRPRKAPIKKSVPARLGKRPAKPVDSYDDDPPWMKDDEDVVDLDDPGLRPVPRKAVHKAASNGRAARAAGRPVSKSGLVKPPSGLSRRG